MTALTALDTKKKGGGVSADLLKLLALVSMTIDHYAAIVIYNGNLYGFSTEYHEMAAVSYFPDHRKAGFSDFCLPLNRGLYSYKR